MKQQQQQQSHEGGDDYGKTSPEQQSPNRNQNERPKLQKGMSMSRQISRRVKKIVRFPSGRRRSMEETRQVSRLSSRALEEKKACWEDKEEAALRKHQMKLDIKRLELVGRQDSSQIPNHTSLGLKDKVGSRRIEKWNLREDAWDAVLDEQDKSEDPVLMASAYRRISIDAEQRARQEAMALSRTLHDED